MTMTGSTTQTVEHAGSSTHAPDGAKVEAFAAHLLSIFTGGLLTYMIDIGHRTGLFTAAAAGPATSEELAARAGLTERYVREWLGAMVTGDVMDFDAATRTYLLSPEHAVLLTGESSMAPLAQTVTPLAKHVHHVARAFCEGGGVPYPDYRPEFIDAHDTILRTGYDRFLIDAYLPLEPGLTERLRAGASVADIACGTGHALVLLARAFPASIFVGYDLDDSAIARARAEAIGAEITNLRFEVVDVARLDVKQPFDVIFAFTAIHDQADPAGVLERIRAALAPEGIFFMKEPRAADDLVGNRANPFAAAVYSISTLHCLPVSLAYGGAGIGMGSFGEGQARRMLADAGFAEVAVHDAPGEPTDALYVTRKVAP